MKDRALHQRDRTYTSSTMIREQVSIFTAMRHAPLHYNYTRENGLAGLGLGMDCSDWVFANRPPIAGTDDEV